MKPSWSTSKEPQRLRMLIGTAIFVLTFLVFWLSPIREMTDSNYAMLVSQNLLQHRTFVLDHYRWPGLQTVTPSGLGANTTIYQIESVNGHLFYYFPPGTSVLSLPYVAVMNAFGIMSANPDGSYKPEGELIIQSSLAALLMAAAACIFFYTGNLALPLNWGILIALASALGTQVWSTASRAMWSDTWAVLLLAAVVWLLLAYETGKAQANPTAVVLATLLAWGYFVRPTNAIPIVAITVYLFIFHRAAFLRYAITGAIWLGLFGLYSWHNFRLLLPNYFQADRLHFGQYWEALAGNLISPSRGLLIFVPVLVFVGYLFVAYWKHLFTKRLAVLSLIIVAAHLLIVSAFTPWHGGGCFGPRYSTGLVPWFGLLAILGIKTMLDERRAGNSKPDARRYRAQLAAGGMLLVLSVFINARGAISYDTWLWNDSPANIDRKAGRVWEWRYPQFLAGLIRPPLPANYPDIGDGRHINLTSYESDEFLWYGWSGPEPNYRWTAGYKATIIFARERLGALQLRLSASPFLIAGKLERQVVEIRLNGQLIDTLILDEAKVYDLSVKLPEETLKAQNILSFGLPNASSLRGLGVGYDQRHLGIAVRWLEISHGA